MRPELVSARVCVELARALVCVRCCACLHEFGNFDTIARERLASRAAGPGDIREAKSQEQGFRLQKGSLGLEDGHRIQRFCSPEAVVEGLC